MFDNATAIAARCCSPPESCPTLWFAPIGQVHQRQELVGAAAPIRGEPRVQHAGQPHVLAHGQVGDQVPGGSLPHEPHALGAIRRERVVAQEPQVLSVHVHDAGGGAVQATQEVQDRGLARAARPDDRQELAAGDVQVDAAERDDAGVADPVHLEDVPQPGQHVPAFGGEPLGAHHRHSASPRRTPVTDERISVRIASARPSDVVTATRSNATPRLSQSITSKGGG